MWILIMTLMFGSGGIHSEIIGSFDKECDCRTLEKGFLKAKKSDRAERVIFRCEEAPIQK